MKRDEAAITAASGHSPNISVNLFFEFEMLGLFTSVERSRGTQYRMQLLPGATYGLAVPAQWRSRDC